MTEESDKIYEIDYIPVSCLSGAIRGFVVSSVYSTSLCRRAKKTFALIVIGDPNWSVADDRKRTSMPLFPLILQRGLSPNRLKVSAGKYEVI